MSAPTLETLTEVGEPDLVAAADAPDLELAAAVATSPVRRRSAFAAVRSTTSGRIALGVLALVGLLAVIGPFVAPYDPNFQNTRQILTGPSSQHLLGTDYVGRDVLSRLLAGSTLSVVTASKRWPSRSSWASSPGSCPSTSAGRSSGRRCG